HPAASAAANRSSPSATNLPARSRTRRRIRSFRISLSLWLCELVIAINEKGAVLVERRPVVLLVVRRVLSRPPAPRGRGRQSGGRCRRHGRRCPQGSCDRARPPRAGGRA